MTSLVERQGGSPPKTLPPREELLNKVSKEYWEQIKDIKIEPKDNVTEITYGTLRIFAGWVETAVSEATIKEFVKKAKEKKVMYMEQLVIDEIAKELLGEQDNV